MRASLRVSWERLSEGEKIRIKPMIVIEVYDLILVGNELIILWNDLTVPP